MAREAKAEEDEAEIVFLKQQALGAARTGLRLGITGQKFGKTSPELVDKFQTGEFSPADTLFGAIHNRSESKGGRSCQ